VEPQIKILIVPISVTQPCHGERNPLQKAPGEAPQRACEICFADGQLPPAQWQYVVLTETAKKVGPIK
jgi:hypothetical protein